MAQGNSLSCKNFTHDVGQFIIMSELRPADSQDNRGELKIPPKPEGFSGMDQFNMNLPLSVGHVFLEHAYAQSHGWQALSDQQVSQVP